MVSKKTSRPPKSVAPAQPPEEKKKKKPTQAAPAENLIQPATVVSDEEIRVHAYFLSLRYVGSDRNDVDFWLLAERELRPANRPRLGAAVRLEPDAT